ncbi:MAG: hypothetical protein WBA23_02985 [Tunicatimonas sp.]|uniref:hypothetical protein n=1 Tax=Tunicatimonas sp. TaxID=1940096 RepID=UPI003C71BE2B
MNAVEFEANITDGVIKVPEQYRDKITSNVRVIILSDTQDDHVSGTSDTISLLLHNPLKVKDFRPLSREDIYQDTK